MFDRSLSGLGDGDAAQVVNQVQANKASDASAQQSDATITALSEHLANNFPSNYAQWSPDPSYAKYFAPGGISSPYLNYSGTIGGGANHFDLIPSGFTPQMRAGLMAMMDNLADDYSGYFGKYASDELRAFNVHMVAWGLPLLAAPPGHGGWLQHHADTLIRIADPFGQVAGRATNWIKSHLPSFYGGWFRQFSAEVLNPLSTFNPTGTSGPLGSFAYNAYWSRRQQGKTPEQAAEGAAEDVAAALSILGSIYYVAAGGLSTLFTSSGAIKAGVGVASSAASAALKPKPGAAVVQPGADVGAQASATGPWVPPAWFGKALLIGAPVLIGLALLGGSQGTRRRG